MEPMAMHAVREVLSLSRYAGTAFGPCPSKAVLSPSLVVSSCLAERDRLEGTTRLLAEAASSAKASRLRSGGAYSVLVVEDDPDIQMALQDLLEFEGFFVDCAQTCHRAFSFIEHHFYDAVLLDLGLPDGDGASILEKLQASEHVPPVIVLTATDRDLGSLRTYARLTKPWHREELCETLYRAIGVTSSSPVT